MASILASNFDDEESDTEFNPGVPQGSDDGGSDNEVSNEMDNRAPPANKIKTKTPAELANGSRSKSRSPLAAQLDEDEDENGEDQDNGEDDEGEGEDLGDDDEEDEEEDDEDDEDAVTGRPRKRRRRLNQFIEEEAEVDEDDDDIEAEDDDIAETGFIQDTHPDDDLGPEADQDDRGHRELDRQRQMEASMDAELAAQRLKERYGRRTTQGLSQSTLVPQNLLMPSVDDPGIWNVKCRPGKEKDVLAHLMRKIQDRINARRPLKICSAFERGGGSMAGFIFVEAKRKADVDEALQGIEHVFKSNYELVPVKEMPDLLRVTKSKPLKIGGHARVKRGLYAGDLGVIEDVVDNGLDVVLRLLPRLTYGLDEDDSKPPVAAEKRKRAAFAPPPTPLNRPPPRLFNENEAKKKHGRFLQANRGLSSRSWTYKNETFEDGFLIKSFRKTQLETENVNAKLEEIMRLTKTEADGSEAVDLEAIVKEINEGTAEGTYVPGDEIEVFQGEQKGIVGRVEGVSGGILRIKVSEGELAGQVVDQPVKGVRKRFREGDHVKVVGTSKYNGEVGMVIRIKDDKITVLTDTSMQEITVFSKDLREAAEAGGSDIKQNMLDVQDLVQINQTECGIVIKADREAVRVLDENSSIITRLPSQLQKLEVRRNAVATDRNGAEIRVGDTIRESGGENKSGKILHINRGHVFVHDRSRLENSGLWTTRCMNVVTVASKANVNAGPDLTKLNPALRGQNGASAMGPPAPLRVGRDRLTGQHVHIRKGMYKGHKGLVKDTTDTTARIELQSKNKVINVPKHDLAVLDQNTGKPIEYAQFASSRGGPFPIRSSVGGSGRPDGFAGGRTPAVADGGRTPAWGGSSSRTPAWSSGDSGKTPAWKPNSGSQTSYGGAGGMTSYGGAGNYGTSGSRTPAWSSSSKTPFGAGDGYGSGGSGYDAFAAGSRTPYGAGASSRTPAWGGMNGGATAQTPAARAFDAPTPAVSAPTPGGFGDNDGYTPYGASAPTPGAGFGAADAPTPGFAKGANKEELKYNRLNAPTPGATTAATPYAGGYDAPTPAAGAPRYADDDDDE
ncbi:transcription elongation factor spt5 [Neophaeococcomyces mojaviensis]|uniref:Transcription elongation factor spt5 n=1 Tax=Neophaeococcomyces mojaviensis TaxID=3383035 RepID=A0ACC2ZS11_9EURO|nr:transcription elongation factor spt5 [Knufia sp. JES_112]